MRTQTRRLFDVGGVPSPRIRAERGIGVSRGGGTPPTSERKTREAERAAHSECAFRLAALPLSSRRAREVRPYERRSIL